MSLTAPSLQIQCIAPGHPAYPEALERHWHASPQEALRAIGDVGLLRVAKLGFLCSIRCRGSIILQTYDYVNTLSPAGPAVVSGFHSPMERKCFESLLRRGVRVIVCPARGIDSMRIPQDWRPAIAASRMLIVSPYPAAIRRATDAHAVRRNLFVAALADKMLISYASSGGKTERFVRMIAGWGKPIESFRGEGNDLLFELGARPAVGPKGAA